MAELYIELQSEKQEPEAIPCCDDRPPEYEACQPDLVPSVIKNREKCGTSSRRLEKAMLELEELIRSIASQGPVGEDQYTQLANEYLTMGRLLDEGSSAAKDLGSVFQERSLNSRIYHVCARLHLTHNEFRMQYEAFRRNPEQQLQIWDIALQGKNGSCYAKPGSGCATLNSKFSLGAKDIQKPKNPPCDSPCSSSQFLELSEKVDRMNEKLNLNLESRHTADASIIARHGLARPIRSFWERFFGH